jgi:hypothetical protein
VLIDECGMVSLVDGHPSTRRFARLSEENSIMASESMYRVVRVSTEWLAISIAAFQQLCYEIISLSVPPIQGIYIWLGPND